MSTAYAPLNHPITDASGRLTAPWVMYFARLQSIIGPESAPSDAEYIVGATNATLTNERLATNSTSNTWNLATAGQAKVERAALTGDVTAAANSNTTTIAANAVTDAKFRQSAALSVVGRSANSTGNVADIAAASDGQVLRRSGTAVGFGAVDLASANAVTGTLPIANGGSLVQRATVTLTNAQIKALPTTGITVVAAPGPGFWLSVLAVDYSSDFTAGAYTNIDATYSDLHVGWGSEYAGGYLVDDSATTPVLTDVTDLFGNTTQGIVQGVRYSDCVPVAGAAGYVRAYPILRSTVANGALTVKMDNNGSGDLTGGNAANSLKVTVLYVVEAV